MPKIKSSNCTGLRDFRQGAAWKNGFTLIEVMIAAVILFSALTMGSLAYRTSVNSVDKIKAGIFIADALPAIMAKVKTEISVHKNQGAGRYSKPITYTWNSKKIKSSKNILGYYDEITGGLQYGHFKVALHKVELAITYNENNMIKMASYEYQVFSCSS